MKRAFLYSLGLHVSFVILLMIGFSNPFRKPVELNEMVTYDFVAISDFNEAPIISADNVDELPALVDAADQQIDPVKPEPIQQAPQPLPMPAPAPTPPPPPPVPAQAVPEPDLPKEPEVDPIPTLEPKKPEPKVEEKPQPPKKEEVKKDDRPPEKEKLMLDHDPHKKKVNNAKKDEKSKNDKQFDDLISDVTNESFDDILNDATKKGPSEGKKSQGKRKGVKADRVGSVMTATDKAALRSHIEKHWARPLMESDKLPKAVKIKIVIDSGANVTQAEAVDKAMLSNPLYRTYVESLIRTLLNPNVNPLPGSFHKGLSGSETREIIISY